MRLIDNFFLALISLKYKSNKLVVLNSVINESWSLNKHQAVDNSRCLISCRI